MIEFVLADTDVVLNLTTGMGGDLDIGIKEKILLECWSINTDMANVMERIANAEQCLAGNMYARLWNI